MNVLPRSRPLSALPLRTPRITVTSIRPAPSTTRFSTATAKTTTPTRAVCAAASSSSSSSSSASIHRYLGRSSTRTSLFQSYTAFGRRSISSSTATTTGTNTDTRTASSDTSESKMSFLRMSTRLRGKTILITGASSGIGRATALEFARTAPGDLRLIITARREDALQALAEEIKRDVGSGVKVLAAKLDMGNTAAIEEFVGSLPAEFSKVDVLVNNAGMVRGVEESPHIALADIHEMFNVNVTGLISMTQAVMRLFHARAAAEGNDALPKGDIIMLGSIAAREGYPGGSIYCATKAAVRNYTEALRKENVANLIRVMEVDPGRVETEFSIVRFRGDKAKADAVYAGTEPLTPEDVAETIVFMAGRRDNVVVADVLLYPQHQGAAQVVHRKS